MDQWSFQATAGDAISVTASESGPNTSFIPRVRVHGPSGQSLGDGIGDLDRKSVVKGKGGGPGGVRASRRNKTDGAGQDVVTLAQAPGTFIVLFKQKAAYEVET